MKIRPRSFCCFTFFVLAATGTQAATITVDAGGTCTLANAITSANTDGSVGDCSAGSGDDTIILKTDVTLSAELPGITSIIVMEGQGYTIDGNSGNWSVLTVTGTGDLTLNEATITGGNPAFSNGAGIHNTSGTVTLTYSTVSGNTASGAGGGVCGGILNENGRVTLTNSTVSGNSADYTGGGIYNGGGAITLNNSTVSGNSAGTDGGGILNDGGSVTLTNSTVSGNRAKSGGGIDTHVGVDNNSSTLTLKNSTVTGNSSEEKGGGISNAFGTVTLISSIITGNSVTTGEGREIYNFGTPTLSIINADSFNLFGHSSESNADAFSGFTPGSKDVTATSNGTKPTLLTGILSPLSNNGGPTKTHALVPGSPAIDLDATCSTGLTEDQRGFPRPVGAGCDAGSFEGSRPRAMAGLYLLLRD